MKEAIRFFRVDLTDDLGGRMSLSFPAIIPANDHVYPQKADFTFCGGLYRAQKTFIVAGGHFACLWTAEVWSLCEAGGSSIGIRGVGGHFVQAKTECQ